MQNDFTRQLILKIVCLTLFENEDINRDKLYFSKDFIREKRPIIDSNRFPNLWIRVNTVQALFDLGQENRDLLKSFYLDNLSILRNLLIFHKYDLNPSDQKITEYLDILLDRFYNDEVAEVILIACICDKLEDLTAISDEDIQKGYITKEDFIELIDFYMS